MKFTTKSLQIEEVLNDSRFNKSLFEQVVCILSPAVTKMLPDGWSKIATITHAKTWLEQRLQEGTVLRVVDKMNENLVGFVFLYAAETKELEKNYRFGYLLGESTWGKGLGTELILGLIEACKNTGNIKSLSGGVEQSNSASIRVLEKCGFVLSDEKASLEKTIFYEYSFL
jgi:RimJ/RimL family protein N-acetyltransferase